MRDSLFDSTRLVRSLDPAARTNGTANGVAVDTNINRQSFRVAMLLVYAGAITDGTHTASVEDSVNGSTGWTAVPAERLEGPALAALATGARQERGIVLDPTRPFLRAVAVTSGATTGGVFGADIQLAQPAQTPVLRP